MPSPAKWRTILANAKKCGIDAVRARLMVEAAIRTRKEIRESEGIDTGGCVFASECFIEPWEPRKEQVEEWKRAGKPTFEIDGGVVVTDEGYIYGEHTWNHDPKTGCIFDTTQDQFAHRKLKGPEDTFFVPPGTKWHKRYHGWESGSKRAKDFLDPDTGEPKPAKKGFKWYSGE